MPLHGTYEPSTDDFSREQVELIERTNGAEGTTMRGMPVIVLVSRGAKSGKIRKIPLMRVEHDGQYAVVASLGGAPKHPTWYYNLVAHPHVELRDGAVVRDYLARELEGAERETWWARSVEAYPDYADYAIKTSRLIPVFVLGWLGSVFFSVRAMFKRSAKKRAVQMQTLFDAICLAVEAKLPPR